MLTATVSRGKSPLYHGWLSRRIGNEDEQLTNYRYYGILIMPLGEAATE
jgi:hypothetical protein